MKVTHHCSLCDYKKIDFKKGYICSVTQRKPQFENTCNTIELKRTMKNQVEEVNSKLFLEKHQFKKDYFKIFVYALGGIFTLTVVYFFHKNGTILTENSPGLTNGLTFTYLFGSIGIGCLLVALRSTLSNLSRIKNSKRKKKIIDKTLALYGVTYIFKKSDVSKNHLIPEFSKELKFNRNK